MGQELANDFMALGQRLLANPMAMVETQAEFWQDYLTLWQRTAQRMLGHAAEPVIEPAKDDRRFRHEQWSENAVFDFIKQSYLLSARCLHGTVKGAEGLDDTTQRKLEFHTRQLVDALSPSNFAHTNPEVVQATMASGGGNLVNGLENLLDDLERGKGELKVSMTDRERVRARQERRHHARQGGVPERADAADPVRAVDQAGRPAAAADHPALDQQVLHSGPAAQEQLHQVLRRPGPDACS